MNNIEMKYKSVSLLITLLLVASCQPTTSSSVASSSLVSSSSMTSSAASATIPDPYVSNFSASYGSDERQVLEYAYLIENTEVKPMVLFLHGGSWIGGDKALMRYMLPSITQAGYMYVSINYRLMLTGATFEDMLTDIQSAIQFLRSNASFLKLDTTQMVIAGESAGAHLAMLYAYKETSPIPIDFVLGLVPPVDFTDPSFLTFGNAELQLFQMNALTGTQIASVETIETEGFPQAWSTYSPIYYAEDAIHTLIGYAGKDELIPSTNIPRLLAAFDTYDIEYDAIFFENSSHNLAGDPLQREVLLSLFFEKLSFYLDN
jgi:acetyl esterase/lipase